MKRHFSKEDIQMQSQWRSVKFPQKKFKSRTTIWSSNSSSRYIPKKTKSLSQRDFCSVLYSIIYNRQDTEAKLKCPSTDDWIKKVQYTHNGVLLSHIKEEILPLWPHRWTFPEGATGQSAWQCRRSKRRGFDPGSGRSPRLGNDTTPHASILAWKIP